MDHRKNGSNFPLVNRPALRDSRVTNVIEPLKTSETARIRLL
jgi:hypothetical protein